MADATLNRSEVAIVRRLVETMGVGPAAEYLGVHPQTINVILLGRDPRRATVAMMRPKIAKAGAK